MKKNKLVLLLASFFLLVGCTTKAPSDVTSQDTSSQGSSESGGSSSSSSSEEQEQLATPIVRLNTAKDGIEWDAVENAVAYKILTNEDAKVQTLTEEKFSAAEGTYNVQVIAVAEDQQYNSEPSNMFTYTTAVCTLGGIDYYDNTATVNGYVGNGMEVKELNDEDFVPMVGSTFVAPKSGIYTFRAAAGFNEENRTYYVHSGSESSYSKTAILAEPAYDSFMFEDAEEETDADLADKYVITKYDDSHGWITSTSTIKKANLADGLNTGDVAMVSFWHHGTWFKYTQDIDFDASYDTVSFYARGTEETKMIVSFEISDQITLGSINLAGVYITYQIDALSSGWTQYTVSLNDPAWKITYGNGKYSFAELSGYLSGFGYNIQSLGDMMPFFNTGSVRLYAPYKEGGPTVKAYFDELLISNDHLDTSSKELCFLNNTYGFESTYLRGRMDLNPDGGLDLNFKYQENYIHLYCHRALNNNYLNVGCEEPGYEFTADFVSHDSGRTFELDSIDGAAAPLFQNFKAGACYVADDFEKYTETGVGYDEHHGISELSGMRANYYYDFYYEYGGITQPQSPMGGPYWWLMGSTNYFDYAPGEGYDSTNGARLKYVADKPMRYTTYGLSDGTASAIGVGETFSFFMKGSTSRAIKLKVRAYTAKNKLTPSSQFNDSVLGEFTLPQTDAWHEYTISLNPNTIVFGFSITVQANWDSGTDFIYLDNVSVYNSVSPYYK